MIVTEEIIDDTGCFLRNGSVYYEGTYVGESSEFIGNELYELVSSIISAIKQSSEF